MYNQMNVYTELFTGYENTVKIQLLTALIAYLLIKLQQNRSAD